MQAISSFVAHLQRTPKNIIETYFKHVQAKVLHCFELCPRNLAGARLKLTGRQRARPKWELGTESPMCSECSDVRCGCHMLATSFWRICSRLVSPIVFSFTSEDEYMSP